MREFNVTSGASIWFRSWLLNRMHALLQEIDVVAKSESTKGGRKITSNGQRDLDLIAGRIVPKGGATEPEDEEEE